LFLTELEEELVGAGAGFLNALKQFRRAARVRRTKRLPQDYFVIVAQAHPFANGLDVSGIFGGRVVTEDGTRLNLLLALFDALSAPREVTGGVFAACEVKPVALDLFLLP